MTGNLLSNLFIPTDALSCSNINCINSEHHVQIKNLYTDIVEAIRNASDAVFKLSTHPHASNTSSINRPGWNEYCKDLYEASRDTYFIWLENGKPRAGPIFHAKNSTKARFKGALRYIKRNEEALRNESLAQALSNSKDQREFWKEFKKINNQNMSLPETIEGVQGAQNIADFWRTHYFNLFNLNLTSEPTSVTANHIPAGSNSITISHDEVASSIKNLDSNKSSGLDGIQSEHLKFCNSRINYLLALCLTGCLVHGCLPIELLSVVIVPLIKNKSNSVCSKSNYRPIALANILSKVFESVLFYKIDRFILTNDNQFGFKRNHSTDLCIYTLKELILKYNRLNSTVYCCFLDASKTFDRVNHSKLFNSLTRKGVPNIIVRILMVWYSTQRMCVRWGAAVSDFFGTTNGVRQGSILSPHFFCVYVDGLSCTLNSLPSGCVIGDAKVNHLMYADDLVLIAPTASGLQSLIRECESFGNKMDIAFNSLKSSILIYKSKLLPINPNFSFILGNEHIPVLSDCKYLGHILSDDMKDHLDMDRQRKKIYMQANMLIKKFNNCSEHIKIKLFRTFCEPMYTPHLWWKYSVSYINKIYVAYNNAFRYICKEPRWCSASLMFVSRNVPSCKEVIRRATLGFLNRLYQSNNSCIYHTVNSDNMYSSAFFKHLLKTVHSRLLFDT